MIHNIFCTYYISLDNNFHRIVFFRDVTNIIDYKKFASINTRTWTPWPRVSAMGVSEREKARSPADTLRTNVCSLSRTRFLHCYLAWIAGERAPFIITICCRVRVSCYVEQHP